ncbi:MAG TPA: hypothetical protein VGD91_15215 [Trebonia sp.]
MATVPELRGQRILPNAHTDEDAAAHVAGEDEETARRLGWWPDRSTEQRVLAAYANWARNWRDNSPSRTFAARDPESRALLGGCELRTRPDGTAEVSYWTHAGLLADYGASIGVTRLEAHIAPTTTPHGASLNPPLHPGRHRHRRRHRDDPLYPLTRPR